MPVRKANAVWTGTIGAGKGFMKVASGHMEGEYSAPSRFEQGSGTNPEELIGAAHAGCYSMALSAALSKAGFKPKKIETTASVHIDKIGEGWKITKIELETRAEIPDIDAKTFDQHAQAAKTGCPVSQALTGTKIELKAKLA
jgi:osmotically inducible protein OsmC